MTTAVTSATSPAVQSNTAPAASQKTSGLTSDFETFVKMLTAQATNQDPLEPMDSTEYAAQLAQFSMVEQQTKSNTLLEGLQSQLGLANMAALSGWVGMEARAVAPGYFDGSNTVTIAPNPAAAADSVTLVVKNASGTEVQRVTLPVSAEPYEWNGLDGDGNPVEAGEYSFVVESRKGDELLLEEYAEVYFKVNETRMQGGEVGLITKGGSVVLASSVSALRDPAG
ncbi:MULTISPECIES: flagellar hook capping FlgD N-terminal domain-containing protein [unclassified Leisingera]|uniref:flagellar hook capping FlgD N-terminal domain-containing protein n=1 Tax=unclassified Leisingera TaxID=2614906 RepID=UPI00031484E7|nr:MULTISPECIES: flagellar hook capping FlgD N-terminal domain-containing protein [unclassified Leisingera]KIC18323.1 flagellar basal body rod modification protein [Leisingera sp. ANG-DT]KIC24251.1 flagellar basal body rod modification protein [Leisingera sp. ANG-S3]KIC26940.1 flagellar basal body rod modification protein [Leisingera sp. ANG-M6]KIC32991.1 flagellar basal body rod modification protein [Leisingera sp. ANG-S5]KIC52967.1 flagellar basal body rod modification protein [Leisingera sp